MEGKHPPLCYCSEPFTAFLPKLISSPSWIPIIFPVSITKALSPLAVTLQDHHLFCHSLAFVPVLWPWADSPRPHPHLLGAELTIPVTRFNLLHSDFSGCRPIAEALLFYKAERGPPQERAPHSGSQPECSGVKGQGLLLFRGTLCVWGTFLKCSILNPHAHASVEYRGHSSISRRLEMIRIMLWG